jgi:DNA invertase Pin-like site-specific DNA recombinase
MTTIKLGYARVSTVNQKTDNQIDQLRSAGCTEIFNDAGMSGKKNHKSEKYQALFAKVRELRAQGEEVTVCVTKLDRFSRSTIAMIEGVMALSELGASFEPLDGFLAYRPGDPGSELMLTIYAGLAQFERAQIIARMSEGMEAKVAKGLRRGQKPKLTAAAVRAIRASYASEPTPPGKLAKEWKVSRSTIIRVLGLYGENDPYVSIDEWEAAKEAANA